MSSLPAARPRLGFLGVGWIGRHRLARLAASGAEVAALIDPDPAACAAVLADHPNARLCYDFSEMLALGLDGVVIATPSAQHAEQAVQALEAGCAVFCQKPLGRDAAETQAVVAAAERADRLLAVDHCYRHVRGMDQLRQRIREGALGRPFAAQLAFHNAYGPDKPWFYSREQAGGGCLMDLGVHLVDLALWLFDYPTASVADSRCFYLGAALDGMGDEVEDFARASLDLANGMHVDLDCSWHLAAGRDAVIEARFYGTEGAAVLRNVNGSFYDFHVEWNRGTECESLAEPPDAWGGRAALAWAEQLARGSGFDPAAWRYAEVARVLDRIYATAGVTLATTATPARQRAVG